MNDEKAEIELEKLVASIGAVGVLKRLGSSVSGAEPCYAGREADVEQGAVEARSEEGMRVTPDSEAKRSGRRNA